MAQMKLWLLEGREDLPVENPWEPWYDKAFGFVVRAATEEAARELAAGNAGDERAEAWRNIKYSTCVPLLDEGKADVILRNFASA